MVRRAAALRIFAFNTSYDPFSISKEDRDFAFELIDKFQQYDETHTQDDEEEQGVSESKYERPNAGTLSRSERGVKHMTSEIGRAHV